MAPGALRATGGPAKPGRCSMTRFAVGVDIGGTSIAAGLVGDDGQVFAELQVPTHVAGAGSAEATMLALIERVLGHPDASGRTVVGIGLGVPALVDAGLGVVGPEVPHVPE